MLKLIIEDDEGRKTVVPFVRDEITIGRQEGNTIRLTERNVSRRHARLLRQNGHILVEDLGSYNGIRINGDKIQGQVQVNEGDLIQIGDYDLAVQRDEASQNSTPTSPLSPVKSAGANGHGHGHVETPRSIAAGAPTMKLPELGATSPVLPVVGEPDSDPSAATMAEDEDVEPLEAAQEDVQSGPQAVESDTAKRQSTAVIKMDQVEAARPRQVVDIDPQEAPRLVVLNTEFAGREFACIRNELKIGRFDDNDIALDHRSLSRTHCKVVREDNGEWRIVDLQSANGLMVNGEPYSQIALRSGDVIELGHLKMKFVGPGENFTLSATADGSVKVRADGSKLPIIAGVILLAAAGLAATYFLVIKKRHPKDDKPVVVEIETPPGNDTPGVDVKQPEINPEENPEALAKQREAMMADAEQLIEAGKWPEAREKLSHVMVDGKLSPEAKKRIELIDAEKGIKDELAEADRLITAGQLEKAKDIITLTEGTKLLKARRAEVATRLKEATEKRIAETAAKQPEVKQPEVKQPEVKQPEVKQPDLKQPEGYGNKPGDVVKRYLEEARTALRAKDNAAAKKILLECLKVDSKAFDCAKLLGSAYAKLGENDNSVKYYRKYLELAPPDEKDRSKVEQLLQQAGR